MCICCDELSLCSQPPSEHHALHTGLLQCCGHCQSCTEATVRGLLMRLDMAGLPDHAAAGNQAAAWCYTAQLLVQLARKAAAELAVSGNIPHDMSASAGATTQCNTAGGSTTASHVYCSEGHKVTAPGIRHGEHSYAGGNATAQGSTGSIPATEGQPPQPAEVDGASGVWHCHLASDISGLDVFQAVWCELQDRSHWWQEALGQLGELQVLFGGGTASGVGVSEEQQHHQQQPQKQQRQQVENQLLNIDETVSESGHDSDRPLHAADPEMPVLWSDVHKVVCCKAVVLVFVLGGDKKYTAEVDKRLGLLRAASALPPGGGIDIPPDLELTTPETAR